MRKFESLKRQDIKKHIDTDILKKKKKIFGSLYNNLSFKGVSIKRTVLQMAANS